jgi:hypothetical protein
MVRNSKRTLYVSRLGVSAAATVKRRFIRRSVSRSSGHAERGAKSNTPARHRAIPLARHYEYVAKPMRDCVFELLQYTGVRLQ